MRKIFMHLNFASLHRIKADASNYRAEFELELPRIYIFCQLKIMLSVMSFS